MLVLDIDVQFHRAIVVAKVQNVIAEKDLL